MGAHSKEERERIHKAQEQQRNKAAWDRHLEDSRKWDEKTKKAISGNSGGSSGCMVIIVLFISAIGFLSSII